MNSKWRRLLSSLSVESHEEVRSGKSYSVVDHWKNERTVEDFRERDGSEHPKVCVNTIIQEYKYTKLNRLTATLSKSLEVFSKMSLDKFDIKCEETIFENKELMCSYSLQGDFLQRVFIFGFLFYQVSLNNWQNEPSICRDFAIFTRK